MSTDNISAFIDKIQTDIALREKVSAIYAEADQAMADAMARLSVEIGTPFTTGELLSLSQSELSEADLAGIAGGTAQGKPSVVTKFGVIRRKWLSIG